MLIYGIVGGDAYIAPLLNPVFSDGFRRNRNVLQRADVGIGPYRHLFRHNWELS